MHLAKGEQYIAYHDIEWGVPVHDDRLFFEFLILEGAQEIAMKHPGRSEARLVRRQRPRGG